MFGDDPDRNAPNCAALFGTQAEALAARLEAYRDGNLAEEERAAKFATKGIPRAVFDELPRIIALPDFLEASRLISYAGGFFGPETARQLLDSLSHVWRNVSFYPPNLMLDPSVMDRRLATLRQANNCFVFADIQANTPTNPDAPVQQGPRL